MFQNLKPPGLDPNRIRAYRFATGLTQAQAGSRLVPGAKSPAARWSDYESGRHKNPDLATLQTMADILLVQPRQLLRGCLDPLPDAPKIHVGRKRGPAPQPHRQLKAPDRFILRPGVLKSFRLTKNISMAAAAVAGGLRGGAPAWSAYEWGKVARPGGRVVRQLAKALGVTVSDIATLPEGVEEAPPLPPDAAKAFREGYEAGYAAGHAEGLWQGARDAVRQPEEAPETIAKAIRDLAAVENPPPAPEPSDPPITLEESLAALNQTVSEAATLADLYAPATASWSDTASGVGGGLDLTA